MTGHVIGENLRRIRDELGLTQAELARHLQACGVFWQRSHIAALEAGNRETVGEGVLAMLAGALERAVADFFAGDGLVRVTPDAVTTRRGLRELFSGLEPNAAVVLSTRATKRRFDEMMPGSEQVSFQADAELAQRLGLRPADVYEVAERLWGGRNLHQERDRRVAELGEMTSSERRARRGHVTRQLIKEITPHLPTPEQAKAATKASEARHRPYTAEELEAMHQERK